MPLNIDFVQVLLHLLNFVILAGGLTLILWKPVKKFTDERRAYYEGLEEKNRTLLEESAKLKEESERKREELDEEMARLRTQIEQETADTARATVETAKQEAARILAKAEADAEKRKEQILESAQAEISELVIGAAQKLLEDTATPERTRELYDEFLKYAEAKVPREETEA
ncbi:MAG: ATP synthase F0 subunit B [Firmicutes bacterium]|nr:ATP synthase F0 subunit B [Bacillota bacterium]